MDATDDYTEYVRSRLNQLRRAAYLLCGDWDRGDDVVQKVLTDLYVCWSRASRVENLDSYVRTMLFRRFLDERRLGWWRRVRLSETLAEIPIAEPDTAARIDVRAALALVPPRQRAVLVLRYFHDQSVEQTAETLRCSPGTVKSQTSRGLAALRRLLGATEGYPGAVKIGSAV